MLYSPLGCVRSRKFPQSWVLDPPLDGVEYEFSDFADVVFEDYGTLRCIKVMFWLL